VRKVEPANQDPVTIRTSIASEDECGSAGTNPTAPGRRRWRRPCRLRATSEPHLPATPFRDRLARESLMRAPTAVCFALVLTWVGSVGVAEPRRPTTGARPRTRRRPRTIPPSRRHRPGLRLKRSRTRRRPPRPPSSPPSSRAHRILAPAFQLYAEIDLPILGIGLVFEGARLVRPSSQKAFCAPLCPRSDLNALDRTTAGYWSPGWQTASDYGLYTVMVAAATLLFADEGFSSGAQRRHRRRRVGARRNRRRLRDDARGGPAASLFSMERRRRFPLAMAPTRGCRS